MPATAVDDLTDVALASCAQHIGTYAIVAAMLLTLYLQVLWINHALRQCA